MLPQISSPNPVINLIFNSYFVDDPSISVTEFADSQLDSVIGSRLHSQQKVCNQSNLVMEATLDCYHWQRLSYFGQFHCFEVADPGEAHLQRHC